MAAAPPATLQGIDFQKAPLLLGLIIPCTLSGPLRRLLPPSGIEPAPMNGTLNCTSHSGLQRSMGLQSANQLPGSLPFCHPASYASTFQHHVEELHTGCGALIDQLPRSYNSDQQSHQGKKSMLVDYKGLL